MSGVLNNTTFIFHEFDGEVGQATVIRLFWKREPGQPSPLDAMPINIAIAHRRAKAKGYTLSSQPISVELQDVVLEKDKGIIVIPGDQVSNYYMLTMQFEVLERPNG